MPFRKDGIQKRSYSTEEIMKKILTCGVLALSILGLAACGDQTSSKNGQGQTTNGQQQTGQQQQSGQGQQSNGMSGNNNMNKQNSSNNK